MKKALVGVALAATTAVGITAVPVNADILYVTPGMNYQRIVQPVLGSPILENRVLTHSMVCPTPRTFVEPVIIRRDPSLLRMTGSPLLNLSVF